MKKIFLFCNFFNLKNNNEPAIFPIDELKKNVPN
jgi:hypothetical protein